jgi:carbonic anhydrase
MSYQERAFRILPAIRLHWAATVLLTTFSLVCGTGRAQQSGAPGAANGPATQAPDAALSVDEALQKLLKGNERFVQGTSVRPDQSPNRRTELSFSQHPFACIVACSDSRVPPEIIFDQGLGSIYVVRVAGNILNDEGLGSIEYAVGTLQAPLVLVLGHSGCEAVRVAVSGQHVSGHFDEVIDALKPAVRATRDKPGDTLGQAINANVELVVNRLKTSKPILTEYVKSGRLKIIGGIYELATGQVELLH